MKGGGFCLRLSLHGSRQHGSLKPALKKAARLVAYT